MQKKFDQEEHSDDCGSDVGLLDEKPLINVLAVHCSLDFVIVYSYLDGGAFRSSTGSSEGGAGTDHRQYFLVKLFDSKWMDRSYSRGALGSTRGSVLFIVSYLCPGILAHVDMSGLQPAGWPVVRFRE